MPNIEDLIQRAIQEGKFSDLPGKGKPLRLDDNPLADPDWQLAYHLLKENGFSLPWLELRQELEKEIEAARQSLKQAWEWRQSAAPDKPPVKTARPPSWRQSSSVRCGFLANRLPVSTSVSSTITYRPPPTASRCSS